MSERYITPAALPTPYENELLTILIEECAEVIQRATKAQRFGLTEVQPGQPLSNSTRLAHEIGDLFEVVDRLRAENGPIVSQDVLDGKANKRQQLAKFMQFKPEAR